MRGGEYIFYGKGEVTGFFRTIKSPLIEFPDNAAILPVYPLSAGVNQKFLRTSTRAALDACSEYIRETLPDNIIKKYGLLSRKEAYEKIHFPKTQNDSQTALRRFVLEELLYFILGISVLKKITDRNQFHSIFLSFHTLLLEYTPIESILQEVHQKFL